MPYRHSSCKGSEVQNKDRRTGGRVEKRGSQKKKKRAINVGYVFSLKTDKLGRGAQQDRRAAALKTQVVGISPSMASGTANAVPERN